MVEKLSTGVRVVQALGLEMKQSIITLAGDRSWSETRERWLSRAARAAGISQRAAKCMFYVEDREPRASTVEKVRRAVAARQEAAEANGRREIEDLRSRIAAVEAALARPENKPLAWADVVRRSAD